MNSTARPTLYVLDALSLIYQVFHAIPLMTGPAGQPTNAVFGVFRDLLNIRRNRKPDYIAIAFDGPGEVFRSQIDPKYKANRPPTPDDLVSQTSVIKRLYQGFRIPLFEVPDFEADDIIATLARLGVAQGLDVVICTADKDARQLLNEHVRILNLRKDLFMDVAKLKEEWDIAPSQVVDLLSLTGDSVDNVSGIPGIGQKTASALLAEFGDLDNLLANIDKVSGAKRKENLKTHGDVARLARKLVKLDDQLALDINWDDLKLQPLDTKALVQLCQDCGFHKFADEVVAEQPKETREAAIWTMDYRVIDTPEALQELAIELSKQSKLSIDTETTGLDHRYAELVGISLSFAEGVAYYLPIRGPMWSKRLPWSAVVEHLGPILANPAIEKIGVNIKFDLHVLRKAGLTVEGRLADAMLFSYLLESGERNHGLDEMARRYLNHDMIPIESLIGKGKNQKKMDEIDITHIAEYAGEDADAAWRLNTILSDKVRQEGLDSLYNDMEEPLIRVLAKMEQNGVKIDISRLKALSDQFANRLATIQTEIHQLAGREFNINSTAQLRQILFEELKLPVQTKTPKGEASTAHEVLEELAPKHPLPRLLIEHRQLEKLKGTYLDALPGLTHKDGRIRATFQQAVAATGRLSSSDPNLQNIPVRTDEGKQIRQAFIPSEPGWLILTADYSQIELRVLAHYCQDPALIKAFQEDRDIHCAVAARIFGVDESEVDDKQRGVAKTVNFGVIYGLSAYGLSNRLGITQTEAEKFIESYFQEYAGVDAFIVKTLESAQAQGRVETIRGRRRAINGIKTTEGRNRNLAERTAINTVIQGSAADLIKLAMLEVDRKLTESKLQARLLLQIHDELLFEAPHEEIPALTALVRESMVNALKLDVPLRVDIASGPNWLDVT